MTDALDFQELAIPLLTEIALHVGVLVLDMQAGLNALPTTETRLPHWKTPM